MKQCCKCRLEKSLDEFRPDKRNRSGVGSQCKSCCREYDRSDNKKNARRLYRKTPEGKLAYKQFRQSVNGKLANQQASRRRRERLHALEPILTNDEALSVREHFDHACFKCGNIHDLTIDHHYPLSKGYALSTDNAVLLCRSCNSAKGSKFPEDFYSRKELACLASILFSVL